MKYEMSKNYEALYDHLCNGGEALGRYLAYEKGPRPALLLSPPLPYTEDGMGRMVGFGDLELDNPEVDMRAEFIAECTRLNLEWLAPVQPLSVDKIMGVVDEWLWFAVFGNESEYPKGANRGPKMDNLRERLNKMIG